MTERGRRPDTAALLAALLVLPAIVVVALGAASLPTLAPTRPVDQAPWVPLATRAADEPPPSPTATPTGAATAAAAQGVDQRLLAALVAVTCLIVLVLLFSVRATARRRSHAAHGAGSVPEKPGRVTADAAERVVADALDRLRGPDASGDAEIIRCWRALEAAGAGRGVSREPAETVAEYVADLAHATRVDTAALAELAGLYEAALYSGRAATAVDRDAAVACLARLAPGLEQSRPADAPGQP